MLLVHLVKFYQQRTRTEATDTDATIFVSIGARSGGIRFAATADGVCRGRECGNEQRSGSRSAAKSNRMARTAGAFAASRISSPPWQ